MGNGPRILVTRSEPGASQTAARLAALGYEPVVEPVFAVEPLPASLPPFDALAFTSANGVRAFARLSAIRDVPVFAVGARTAEIARQHGFPAVASADGDVGALAALIIAQNLPTGAALLHVGNEETRGDLSGVLKASGINAEHVALYRAAPAAKAGPALDEHLRGGARIDAILIHSPRGAAILAQHVAAFSDPAAIDIAAISAQALAPVDRLANRAEIAAAPDEESLMDALRHLLRP